jgi:hypothetical protein
MLRLVAKDLGMTDEGRRHASAPKTRTWGVRLWWQHKRPFYRHGANVGSINRENSQTMGYSRTLTLYLVRELFRDSMTLECINRVC